MGELSMVGRVRSGDKQTVGLIASVAYIVGVAVLFWSVSPVIAVVLTLPWSLFAILLLIVGGLRMLPSDTGALAMAVACAVINVWSVYFCVRMARKYGGRSVSDPRHL